MTEYIAFTTVAVPPNFLVRTMQPAKTHAAPLYEPEIPPGTLTVDVVSTGAFGSGAHPTTQLCLTALGETVTARSSVLDLGCGSGVLAIAAAKLGAAKVVAVDIEQAAVIRTRDNAELNGIGSRIDVRFGSTETAAADGPYDVLAANLLAPIFIRIAADLPPLLHQDSIALFSGILDIQAPRVIEALAAVGIGVHDTRSAKGWCVLLARLA